MGAAVLTLLVLAASAQLRVSRATTTFEPTAVVTDVGEQIVSLTIDTSRFGVDAAGLDTGTFRVHATGANPYRSLDPATVTGTYDCDRVVTGVNLTPRGDILLALRSGPEVPEAFTVAHADGIGRSIALDIRYTITQRKPITTPQGRLRFDGFTQGRTTDPEVNAFAHGESRSGLKYRLFAPVAGIPGPRPLIVWLHGGGEGGWAEAQHNDLQLIANRGALGFTTDAAQRIFGGAYVVAPQATDFWMNDAVMGYTPRLKSLLDELVAAHPIDPARVYLVGASNGGYQTLALAAAYPHDFAAAVPVCPGVRRYLSDAQLAALRSTPTWIVQSRDDPVLPFADNGRYAYERIGNALLSAYDRVVWDGRAFSGHSSWIYVAHNDPVNDQGQHLYQWLAAQRASSPRTPRTITPTAGSAGD